MSWIHFHKRGVYSSWVKATRIIVIIGWTVPPPLLPYTSSIYANPDIQESYGLYCPLHVGSLIPRWRSLGTRLPLGTFLVVRTVTPNYKSITTGSNVLLGGFSYQPHTLVSCPDPSLSWWSGFQWSIFPCAQDYLMSVCLSLVLCTIPSLLPWA